MSVKGTLAECREEMRVMEEDRTDSEPERMEAYARGTEVEKTARDRLKSIL